MRLNKLTEAQIGITINSLLNYIQKLDSELTELSTYRKELDNPIIVQALALEQKRISDLKADTGTLAQEMQREYGKTINV